MISKILKNIERMMTMEETYKEIIQELVRYCQNCDILSTSTDTLIRELLDLFGFAKGMEAEDIEELLDY